MGLDTMLYAWARPIKIDRNLDHTWVTDYTPASSYPDIASVTAANKNYWFCWGTFHDDNYRDIGDDRADLALAKCLVAPNDSDAHGTIFRYAFDGVCHQLANQVLYSTQSKMVVSRANGYGVSHYFFGTYGRQHTAWQDKINACTSVGGETMNDFENELAQTLSDKVSPEQVDALLELRADFLASLEDMGNQLFTGDKAEGGAAEINSHVSALMAQAHEILGDKGFAAVFNTEMRDMFGLVDPEMFAESEAAYAKSLAMSSKE